MFKSLARKLFPYCFHQIKANMSKLQLVAEISRFFPIRSTRSCRTFVTAPSRPLQDSRRDDKGRRDQKKEKAADKTIEQAEAVKEAAREVRKTCEFVRDTGASVIDMTQNASEKVCEAAEAVTEKAKGAWGTAKNTTDIIKDKIVGK